MNIMDEDELSNIVIGMAIEVHRHLGPGLLESAYESAMAYELIARRIPFERQKEIPIQYKGNCLDSGFRADLLVNKLLIVELKSVDELARIHQAQVLTYLKLTGLKLGLLLNFNVTELRFGIKRVAFNLPEKPRRINAKL